MLDQLQQRIDELLGPSIGTLGYDLVRVRLSGDRRRTLQLMIERKDRAEITVDDCAIVSRAASARLDVDDPIPGAYDLEVSSPGIDRPLVRPADYQRFAGFEARIELQRPVNGKRRFMGTLRGLDDEDNVSVGVDGNDLSIPHAEIKAAKLVLTDALIEASRSRRI